MLEYLLMVSLIFFEKLRHLDLGRVTNYSGVLRIGFMLFHSKLVKKFIFELPARKHAK